MTVCETSTSQLSSVDKKKLSSKKSARRSEKQMYDYVVLLLEEGVLGMATQKYDDLMEVEYYLEGIQFTETFDQCEYTIVQHL